MDLSPLIILASARERLNELLSTPANSCRRHTCNNNPWYRVPHPLVSNGPCRFSELMLKPLASDLVYWLSCVTSSAYVLKSDMDCCSPVDAVYRLSCVSSAYVLKGDMDRVRLQPAVSGAWHKTNMDRCSLVDAVQLKELLLLVRWRWLQQRGVVQPD